MKQTLYALSISVLCCALPACGDDDDESRAPFGGGAGTEADPYQISTIGHLNNIRDNGAENYLDDHFVLMNDLDFSDYTYADNVKGWLPIAHDTDSTNRARFDGTRFTGRFDGQGFTISHLRIDRGGERYVGLFGGIGSGGVVHNVGLGAVNVRTRLHQVGGLAGTSNGSISNSYVKGRVSGGSNVGMLLGFNEEEATVASSYSAGTVSGVAIVGGLVGSNDGQATIRNSYSTAQPLATRGDVGGLVGFNIGTIRNCYAVGRPQGPFQIGGLMGRVLDDVTVTSCYWNTTISRTTVGAMDEDEMDVTSTLAGLTGLTTAEMYVPANFVGWDFTAIWQAPSASGQQFPLLRGVEGQ